MGTDKEFTSDTEVTIEEKDQLITPVEPDKSILVRLYNNIDESSKNCRRIFLIYLGFLAYSLLTITTTSDHSFVFGHEANLPIINTTVPYDLFLFLTPFLAIFFFIYIQLYLIKIDSLIEYLITICKKEYGAKCKEKPKCKLGKNDKVDIQNICKLQQNYLYPWIIIFSKHYETSGIGILQRIFVKFTLWWLLPIVLMTISLFVVKKHVSFISYALLCTVIGGNIVVIAFWHKLDKYRYLGKLALVLVALIFWCVLSDLIPIANKGILSSNEYLQSQTSIIPPQYLKPLERFANVNLSQKKLITVPKDDEKFDTLYWINLENRHLEGANLESAILVKANLKRSHLEYANLLGANLQNANLVEANLNFANLGEANLNDAIISDAKLLKSDLISAKLERVDLSGANLEEADLQGANLKDAKLRRANLKNAKLNGSILCEAKLGKSKLNSAELQKANLNSADLVWTELYKANLREAELEEAVLYAAQLAEAELTSANLQRAILNKANLKGANLHKADLQGANLLRADLSGADLREAKLEGTIFLGTDLRKILFSNYDQFANVKTLYQAKLDKSLMIELQKRYPGLFNKPVM
jgi:uncharacterized protein YjbI with pentapeptide repeats